MEPILVKIGGEIVEDAQLLDLFTKWLHHQQSKNQPVVIVHGAGKQVDILSKRMNVKTTKHEGRRVTDQKTLNIFIQAMAGSVNKKLVSELRNSDLSPVGLTAADGNISTSVKRKPLNINGQDIDFGYVGEIMNIDPKIISLMLRNHFLPVIGCLTWSVKEGLLNINADTLAMKLSLSLQCHSLILLTKTGAVLNENQIPLKDLSWTAFQNGLKNGWIKDGMIPKLQTGFEAISKGISSVLICNPETLLHNKGTKLYKDQEIKNA